MTQVKLRELEAKDVAVINSWRQDYEHVASLGSPFRFINLEVDEKWFQNYMAQRSNNLRLAAYSEDEPEKLLGVSYLNAMDWVHSHCWSSIMLAPDVPKGQGIGSSIAMQTINHAWKDLNLSKIQALILEDNELSLAMHKKCGYKEEGVLKNYFFKEGQRKNVVLVGIEREL
ncbi:MAG: GNAT family N-acetyltransferase [Bdellovibrionales bacterium]|nr:GNAT family N-acetyltransferase [Bdellovibrionales bacterium]